MCEAMCDSQMCTPNWNCVSAAGQKQKAEEATMQRAIQCRGVVKQSQLQLQPPQMVLDESMRFLSGL